MGHIFGVGLNKTGTTSLTAALKTLGFTALHHDEQVDAAMQRAHDEGVPLLTYAEQVDAYLDTRPVEQWFEELDAQYPDSRFILTTRSVDDWLASRERHVRRNQARAKAGVTTTEWLTVDRQGWEGHWHAHHARVRSYFAGRDDLLEIDFTVGDGWDTLAPFLGRPMPDAPLPWRNRQNLNAAQKVRRKLGKLRKRLSPP